MSVPVRLVGAPERRRPRAEDPPRRALAKVPFIVLGLALVSYVGWTAIEPHYAYSSWFNGWVVDSFEVLVAGLCMARAAVRRPGRTAAFALGIGLLSWAVGDLIYTSQSSAGATNWGPTWADVFWLGFYPFAYVGVVLFMRREVRRVADPSWLDGVVAALGSATLCSAFAFAGLQLQGAGPLDTVTYVAYPIGDLLLFALVVGGATLLSRRKLAPWVVLATAMALNAFGDTFNLFHSALGTPRVDAVFRALAWPAAGLLVCVAVWARPKPRDLLRTQRPAGFALPGVFAVAALGVLIFATFHPITHIALALAVATMVAVGTRTAISLGRQRAIATERMEQSLTDDLTGLRNRRYLMSVLDAFFDEQSDAPSRTRRLAFLYIDLVGFKAVNDSFGHAAGDELLKQLAPRLGCSLRSGEVLVRLGGGEFGVLLMGEDAGDAGKVAERLLGEIERPFVLEGLRTSVSANIGIASAGDCAGRGEELLHCADMAMYRAKQGNSCFAIYDADLDGEGSPWQLSDELRLAIELGQLELHYQPQLDLKSNQFTSAEALVRWPHPRLRMVPPAKFLPLAQDAGLMPALTSWVLGTGLAQCATWREAGVLQTVSINVSPDDLLAPDFVSKVVEALTVRNLPPDALIVEVTETSIIANLDEAKLVVDDLHTRGVAVSIDDFGAGFTSLAYLSDLAVGELKLDGQFVTGLFSENGQRDRDLIRATIDLGHVMGLRVVAECIEDQATLDLLRQLGCDVGQGYLISRPVPADRLTLGGDVGRAMASQQAG